MASETIYDHPLYYDILFGWDRSREADFYAVVFARCGVGADEPVLEVACGTGQVARRLARRGRRVAGMDSSPAMLAFLRAAADDEAVRVETMSGDMRAFDAPARFAAAYNPMSSFRLLQTDAAADAHFAAISAALRPGGVYVLDLTFARHAGDAEVTTEEAWDMTRGCVRVWADDAGVRVRDGDRRLQLDWGAESHLRVYTPEAFEARVDAAPGLEVEAWHPELPHTDDVSDFDALAPAQRPVSGRAMVVLRRVRARSSGP